MRFKHFVNPVEIVKKIMNYYIEEGYIVLDCTVGNGNDTIDLARLVGKSGKVYGFDIQEKAILHTQRKLAQLNLDNNVELINDGHENIDKYIDDKLDFIVYNLGYLPGGDKSIKTKSSTTIESLKVFTIAKKYGLLLITYIGHDGGKDEKCAENLLKSLDQKSTMF